VLKVFARVQAQREGRTVEGVLTMLEADLGGWTAIRERAASIGEALTHPPAPEDVLAWLLCEAKRVEEQAAAQLDAVCRADGMAYATRLRGYQAILACLGVQHSGLLFRLRDADLHPGEQVSPAAAPEG
jgi:hypothetical protein